MADTKHTTPIRLSSLIRDPFVRAAFQRAELDSGQAFAVPSSPLPSLTGGAVERKEAAYA